MKDHIQKFCIPLALATALMFTPDIFAEVYKTVDENGNVVYTDQSPGPDAEPVVLRGLSIISPQRPAAPAAAAGGTARTPAAEPETQEKALTVRELKNYFSDFAIASPTDGQIFAGTGNEVSGVAWSSRYRLQAGMMVTVYLNGVAQTPTTDSLIEVGRLDRGSYEVYAELKDSRNRMIATTEPVTFHMRQHSVNFPARLSGGG